jgi:integral membrane protein
MSTRTLSTTIRWFKAAALAEAVSYLALLAASVAKRAADGPDLVSTLGPIHGVIFLAYLCLALFVRTELRWNLWTTVMVVVAAVVPFGGFVVERRLPGLDARDERGEPERAAVSS